MRGGQDILLEVRPAAEADPAAGLLRTLRGTERPPIHPAPRALTTEARRQRLPFLPINGAVLCDYPDLDPAGRWCDCSNPNCPHAAYLVELFPNIRAACDSARARAERFAQSFLPSRPQQALESHRLHVRWLRSDNARGHDYRERGCGIPDAMAQLRAGKGIEPAWREIKRQHSEEGADGALLKSPHTPDGLLFLYASALETLSVSEVIREIAYPFR